MSAVGSTIWDAIVVGAGPAGGVAAALLGQRGWRVLLVEKSPWPREKVCGGCLNAGTAAALEAMGVPLESASAARLNRIAWHVGARTLELAAGGVAILRAELDEQIVKLAMSRGCEFVHSAAATLLPCKADDAVRTVALKFADGAEMVQGRVVLAADGIGGTLLAHEPWAKWEVDPAAWMGVATTSVFWPPGLKAGTVHMHVGYDGYVGLVRLHDERVHLAAALEPEACRSAGGPAELIKRILQSCGRTTPAGFTQSRFRGTGELTRERESLGGHRALAIGDACGYVEPFTGEGIGWSIDAARAVAHLLGEPTAPWPADMPVRWRKVYAKSVARRQRWCQRLRPIMHHPTLAALAVNLGRGVPAVGRYLAACAGQSAPAAAQGDA